MNLAVVLLHVIGYAFVSALPRIFFKRGKPTLMWLVTTFSLLSPFYALTLTMFGVLTPMVDPASNTERVLEIVSVPFAVTSIALIVATVAVHRVPLALYHQPHDPPAQIVTWGPYRVVRHPFYVSFLVLDVATAILTPQVATIGGTIAAFTLLTLTARREEKRLLGSELGGEYAAYLRRTGRFFPRLFRAPAEA